jgi:hypothetical protein
MEHETTKIFSRPLQDRIRMYLQGPDEMTEDSAIGGAAYVRPKFTEVNAEEFTVGMRMTDARSVTLNEMVEMQRWTLTPRILYYNRSVT